MQIWKWWQRVVKNRFNKIQREVHEQNRDYNVSVCTKQVTVAVNRKWRRTNKRTRGSTLLASVPTLLHHYLFTRLYWLRSTNKKYFTDSIAALQDRSSLGLHPGMLEVINKSIPGLWVWYKGWTSTVQGRWTFTGSRDWTKGTAMSRDTDGRILSVVLEIVAPSHYLPRRYLTY